MLKDLFMKDKTLKGSAIMLIIYLLSHAGIESSAGEVAGIAGAGIAVFGWICKIIKKARNK